MNECQGQHEWWKKGDLIFCGWCGAFRGAERSVTNLLAAERAKQFTESDGFAMWVRGEATMVYLNELLASEFDAYAREQVERYALRVDDPRSMHLHYDGCPFKPYADKFDVDIPEPRPPCTCAEAHKAAYWKGQWSLEQSAGRLRTRQQVEAFRERAMPHLDIIQRKCEQYWNERDVPNAPEFHAILEFIFREAAAIQALKSTA